MRRLWGAVVEGSVDEVEKMLQGGLVAADVSNNSGLQAIHLAAKTGNVELAGVLLRHGACVNAKSVKGNTALHTASLIGHVEMAKLLLSNAAEVNVMCDCNEDTFTPLYMAAQGGHQELVTLLLIHGADPLSKTKNGFSAYDIANQQGHVVISELLEEYSKQKQQHNDMKKCWQAENNHDDFAAVHQASKPSMQRQGLSGDQRTTRYQLRHLLPQQRNRIRCSRSCDKMMTRGELTRMQLHGEVLSNKANNKAINKVKAPSVCKQDFLQTPRNSPMRHKVAE